MSIIDRLVHVTVAFILCSLCVDGKIRMRTDEALLLSLAVIIAFSSLFGVSPVYSLFHFSTYNELLDE
jgi:hypothetical protein